MGVTSGPAAQLTPPHQTSAAASQGPETAPAAAYAGASAQLVGPEVGQTAAPRMSPAPARVGSPRLAPDPRPQRGGAELAGRAGPDWVHPARAPPLPPYLDMHLAGPPGRPRTRAPAHEDPGNPGGLARRPHPAALTSRGLALPALATAPRPSGAGRGPAQDTPPAAAASARGGAPAGSLHPARPRACVTEGWSLAPSSPVSRKPRPQRPSSAKSRLPQANAQWHPAWLGRPRPSGRAAGGPAAARHRGSERAASPRRRAAALARREPGLLASRHALRGSLRDLGRASAPCACVSASEVGMGAAALALQSAT